MHQILNSTATDAQSIHVDAQPVTIGRGRECSVQLGDATISRRHATLTRTNETLLLEDHDSRYGTFVNGTRIRRVALRRGDRVLLGTSTWYRVTTCGLVHDLAATGMSLTVDRLAVMRSRRLLLRDVSFHIESDRFVGILGPSGAGKSTLLHCIASFFPPCAGKIYFDGANDCAAMPDVFRVALGHVPQDDVVDLGLSVQENLAFAARLRAMHRPSRSTVRENVARALSLVGLTEHASQRAAVLSGGQRKRVSVAQELVQRPRLLLLDEPTSGLDPANEARLMEELRTIARQGTSVICTTHLMENVRLFDEVVVLGVAEGIGRLAYVGAPDRLLAQLGCNGFADLYEKLASGAFVPLEPQSSSRLDSATAGNAGKVPTDAPPRAVSMSLPAASTGSSLRQMLLCTFRSARLLLRDPQSLFALALQPVVLGGLACLTQYQASRLVTLYFLAIVIAIWLGINNSARELVRERKRYVRERLAGLQPMAYLAAKVAMLSAIGTAQVALLTAVLWYLGGAVLDPDYHAHGDLQEANLYAVGGVLGLSYLGGLGLGLIASALANSQESAVACTPLLILPQLLVSVVACGAIEEAYMQRPSDVGFRSLASMPHGPLPDSAQAGVLNLLSLGCFSRAALLVLQPTPPPAGSWQHHWVADLAHLALLIGIAWLAVVIAFLQREERWMRLVGIG